MLLTRLASNPNAVSILKAHLPAGSESDTFAIMVATADPDISQARLTPALEAMSRQSPAERKGSTTTVADAIVNSKSPAQALQFIFNAPASQDRDAIVSATAKEWAKVDPVGLSSVLASRPQGEVPDEAIKALVGEIPNDPEAIIIWSSKMADRNRGMALARAAAAADPGRKAQLDELIRSRWSPAP